MKTKAFAIVLAAVMVAAAGPASAGCAKSYRAAKAAKPQPAVAKSAQPTPNSSVAATSGLDTSSGLGGSAANG